ncbi:MAG: hypothetical protein K6F25_05060 [Bacteroidales bacterium]|nr:hypothetical protein [Bacteroidales bacterium]
MDYGLRFQENTYTTTVESSLLLNGGKAIRTGGRELCLEFDMRNPTAMQFGSVLRIAPDNGNPVDLIYYVNDKAQFILAVTFGDNLVDMLSSTSGIGDWHHVSVTISPSGGSVSVAFDDEVRTVDDPGIAGLDRFRCAFGNVGKLGAGPEEIAGVDIRDVTVRKDGILLYRWPLKAHGEGFCLDEVRGAKAVEEACEWLADRYVHWNRVLSVNRSSFLGTDMGDGCLWLCMKDRIERFDCLGGRLDTIRVRGGVPACYADHHVKYVSGKLLSYNLEDGSISVFDPESAVWSNDKEFTGDYCHFSNTTSVDTLNHRFLSFGGYGLYQFSDDFSVLDYGTGAFRQESIERLSFRYRPCSAIVNGKLYVHGGYGTSNGHQGFAVRYYDDLFKIDPETFEVEEIWVGESSGEGQLPSENMIWDEEGKCFYLVRNDTGFTVEKITLDRPGRKALTLPLDVAPHNGAKYPNNLFRCRENGKLYCVTETTNADSSTDITLMDMSWPPADVAELTQELPDNRWIAALLAGICLLCGLYAGFSVASRRRKGESVASVSSEEPEAEYAPAYDFSRSSISLLGGFKVMDKEGNDITSSFTPTLKSMLVLIILSTPKGGILKNRFDRIIWPYKPEDTANNNRNVYLSRLRPLLDQVGDVNVVSKNKILSLETADGVTCDYLEIMRLFGTERSNGNIRRITELLLKGQLLPNMEQAWTEPYKKELSSKTVEMLGYQLRRNDLPAGTTLGMADLVLKYDYLNEDALRAKCRTLVAQGKTGLAKDVYDIFRAEYQDVMGIDYPLPFNRIIE